MRTMLAVLAVTPLLLVAGCDGSSARHPVSPPVTPAALPAAYSFVLTSNCGERSLIGTYRVRVEGGRVVRAEAVGRTPEPRLEEVPTLADLEAKIQHAAPDAVVDVERDDAGVLTSVSIDPRQDTIDDEECYEVSRLRGRAAESG